MTIRESYSVLLAPQAVGTADEVLDLPEGTDVGTAADALDALFAQPAGPGEIDLVVGGENIGRVSREHLIGGTRQIGDSDGATVPGRSFKYRLVRLRCSTCGAEVLRIHLDDRDPPSCPSGHGLLARCTVDG